MDIACARVKNYQGMLRASLKAYLQRDVEARQGNSPTIN